MFMTSHQVPYAPCRTSHCLQIMRINHDSDKGNLMVIVVKRLADKGGRERMQVLFLVSAETHKHTGTYTHTGTNTNTSTHKDAQTQM